MGLNDAAPMAWEPSAVAQERTLVSVIIPTLNEGLHIRAVIDDMLGQEGLDADIEVLVADGGVRTRRGRSSQNISRRNVRLIDNPKRYQVYGYNLAIRAARGSIICIIHAHADISGISRNLPGSPKPDRSSQRRRSY